MFQRGHEVLRSEWPLPKVIVGVGSSTVPYNIIKY